MPSPMSSHDRRHGRCRARVDREAEDVAVERGDPALVPGGHGRFTWCSGRAAAHRLRRRMRTRSSQPTATSARIGADPLGHRRPGGADQVDRLGFGASRCGARRRASLAVAACRTPRVRRGRRLGRRAGGRRSPRRRRRRPPVASRLARRSTVDSRHSTNWSSSFALTSAMHAPAELRHLAGDGEVGRRPSPWCRRRRASSWR